MFNICDAHNDLLYVAKSEQQFRELFYKQVPEHLKKIFCAYFSYNEDKNINVDNMAELFKMAKKIDDRIVPTVENSWFVTPENIDTFLQAQPFCATLTHNKDNNLCGGALEYGDFTNWGKRVVQLFNDNKIILDTAHMNRQSFWNFIDTTYRPIFNSHCGFEEIFSHKRNLTNEQIEVIVQSKGYIGLALYPQFFTNNLWTVENIVDTILWFWNKFGTNTLGWGTDFNGIENYPESITCYSDMQRIAESLLNKGAKKLDIEKLFSKNLLSFIKNKDKMF